MATPIPVLDETAPKTFPVEVLVTIEPKRIADLLCSAFEGGSNYWYMIAKFKKPPLLYFQMDPERVYRHIDYPLNAGGSVVIEDQEDGNKKYTLNIDAILRGLKILAEKYPKCFADFMSEDDDAGTADVFLQCCLFGEAKYG